MKPFAEPESAPDAETLLRSIAAAAPGLWYPQRHADTHGIPRDALTDPLWLLRQAGLVEVGDWVKGLGQGLRLSPHGEKAVATPTPLAVRPPSPTQSRAAPNQLVLGDEARNAVLDPPPAVVAPTLLYANLAWFAVGCILAWRGGVGLEFLKGDRHPGAMDILMDTGAVTAVAVWRGDWWRLASSCFVHIGLFHLLCNMLMLGMLGPFAEGLWGRWRFALIYAVSGVAGGMAAIALNPVSDQGANVLMAGASGALWGMLTAMVVWMVHNRRHLPPELTRDRLQRLGFLLMLNVGVSFVPGVSAEAHFGGGVAGALVAWSVASGRRRPRLWAVGGVTLVSLLALLILLAAVRWSDGWQAVKKWEQLRIVLAQAQRVGEELMADRAAIREAVGEDDRVKLSPKQVESLRDSFAAEQKSRLVVPKFDPKSLVRRATEMAERATAAAGRIPSESELAERHRDYLRAVAAFATAVRAELARPPRADTPELVAAWQAFTAARQQLGFWD